MLTSEELANPNLLPEEGSAVKTTRCTASQFSRVQASGRLEISFVPTKGAPEVIVHLHNGEKGDLTTVVKGDVLVIRDARQSHSARPGMPYVDRHGDITIYGNAVIGNGSMQINYGREQTYPGNEVRQPLRVVVLLPPELNIMICDDFDGAVGITDDMTRGMVSVRDGLDVTMKDGMIICRPRES